MAVYSITCYFNTGFNAQNIPDSPAILATAQSKTFPSNWLLQNKDRVQTRVNAGWDEISEVDYVKIGDAYYYVVNVNMLTETNAELTLVMDFLTTLGGVRNITISDGWVKRAHVKDDTLFYNVQPEPFKPSANMIIDGAQELKPSRVNERYLTTYVGATIDLLSTERLAEEYKNASDETLVSVPKVTPISKETTVKMTLPNGNVEENTLPNQTLYEFDKEAVKEGIRSARSLGLDTAITSCYVVPDGWRRTISMNTAGDIRSITGACEEVTPSIPFKYETGDMRVLLRNILPRIEQKQYDIRFRYGLQCLDDREFLDRLKDFPAFSQARGIYQRIVFSVAFERNFDRIARRSRQIESDDPFFAEKCVDHGRLADIGTPDDRQPYGRLFRLYFIIRFLQGLRHFLQRLVKQRIDTVAMRR